jgi:hypothetical protein
MNGYVGQAAPSLSSLNRRRFDSRLSQRPVKSEKSTVATCGRRPWKLVVVQYTLDLTNSYLGNLGFNGSNFGAGPFREYRTSPVETSEAP